MTRRQGEVVRQFNYWAVVDPGGSERARFVVVDTSPYIWRGRTPVQVHGPATRQDCETWARVEANLWAAVKGQTP